MDYRGFGGGLGFGTPVVSYAPRPMLTATISLVIMEAVGMLGGKVSAVLWWRKNARNSGGLDHLI
jgi:hypothetical protein